MWTCPECGGVMWEVKDGQLFRFRCHVGHAYSPESLFSDQTEALESALWTAARALEERAALARRLAVRMRERHSERVAQSFDAQALEAEQHANVVRDLIARQILAAQDLDEEAEE